MGSSHIKWNEWNNIPNLFSDLRNEEDFFDVTLAIDEDNQCPAHKVILSAASPFFRGILKRNPSQHPSIVMPTQVRPTDLQNILDFIYQGEVNVPESELENFLNVGEILKIRGLTANGNEMPGMIFHSMEMLHLRGKIVKSNVKRKLLTWSNLEF